MPDIRQTSFEIVHRLRLARTRTEIYSELRRSGDVFGYEAFLVAGLPRAPHENLDDCALISGWPSEWARRYHDRRYMHDDPVIRHIRSVSDPFLWQEAVEILGAERGMVVMAEARAFRLHAGFCVPFHLLDGSEAGVSFGGERFHLSSDERAGLHLVAIYAMSAARAISRRQLQPDQAEEPCKRRGKLSGRETECLKWSSAGKSAWEISMILSISARTVEQHLASAARKLGTVSRVQCVAEALRRGLIG